MEFVKIPEFVLALLENRIVELSNKLADAEYNANRAESLKANVESLSEDVEYYRVQVRNLDEKLMAALSPDDEPELAD